LGVRLGASKTGLINRNKKDLVVSQYELYQSQEFREALKECKIFRLKYPRGGHYNDGFELLGKLVFTDGKLLLEGLGAIGANYLLHKEKPECWCPPPFDVEGIKYWIEYKNECECFGYKTYIRIGTETSDFSIEFNFNSTSWYDVIIEDVQRAISFERILISNGIL